ncbi:MAG TPA: ABC transporter ATP-binding protein [Clostridiales bacterium]|nr:ABC transporter ATP-binding protein [Clostridiales bacterium]
MFNFKNVKYKDILDIKDLHIEKNKITCIVGESGSGKTTLLKLFNKLISPDKGKIKYMDKNLRDFDSVKLRREVVMLPQSPAIYEGSVKDNLLIGLKFSEKDEVTQEDSLMKILKEVSLNKNLQDNAEKMSGGEQQRLALGRIILLDPNVYLLDEPSSALDEETEYLVIEKMVDHVRKNNKTLIMVTHTKRIAEEFADNIVEVKKGKIVSSGGVDHE